MIFNGFKLKRVLDNWTRPTLFFLALGLSSCLSPHENALYESDALQKISVYIHLSNGKTSDTIEIGDSLTFFARVGPSAIAAREYFWSTDTVQRSMELIFTHAWQISGLHWVRFQLRDRFGDTLSDSIAISVRPSLSFSENQENFSPPHNSRGLQIDPVSGLHFQWELTTPRINSLPIYHRFLLLDARGFPVLDTILRQASLDLQQQLQAWQQYSWRVELHDSLGSPIISTTRNFSTAGPFLEGCVEGVAQSNLAGKQLQVRLEGNGQPLRSQNIIAGTSFRFCPVLPGDYRLHALSLQYPEFTSDSVFLRAMPGELTMINALAVKDTTPPTVVLSPTTDYHHLKLVVRDLGSGVDWNGLVLWINGTATNKWSRQDSILSLATQGNFAVGTHSILIRSKDLTGNLDTTQLLWSVQLPALPAAPNLLAPAWRGQARTSDYLRWNKVYGPVESELFYVIFACLEPQVPCNDSVAHTGDTLFAIQNLNLPADSLVYWRVEVRNFLGQSNSSQQSTFEFLGAIIWPLFRRRRRKTPGKSPFYIPLILLPLLVLGACEKDALYREGSGAKMETRLFLIPGFLLGASPDRIQPTNLAVVTHDEEVELWGTLLIDGQALGGAQSENYAQLQWVLDGSVHQGSTLRRRFSGGRAHNAIFEAIDVLGDTLRDTLVILANYPLRVIATAPNPQDAEPWHGSHIFRWNLRGIDPWESPLTILHLHRYPDSVFQNPVAQIWNENSMNMPWNMVLGLENLSWEDTSYTFYYALVTISSGFGAVQRDSSAIQLLRSRLRGKTLSTIEGRLRSIWPLDGANWEMQLQSVSRIFTTQANEMGVFQFSDLPPGTYILTGKNPHRGDMILDSTVLAIPAGVYRLVDTLRLRDTRPPQLMVVGHSPWPRSEGVKLVVSEGGSGLDTASLIVSHTAYALSGDHNSWPSKGDSLFHFVPAPSSTADSAWLWVSIADRASNRAIPIQWKVSWTADSIYLRETRLSTGALP